MTGAFIFACRYPDMCGETQAFISVCTEVGSFNAYVIWKQWLKCSVRAMLYSSASVFTRIEAENNKKRVRETAGGGYWSVCGRLKFSGRWASYSCLALVLPMSTILYEEGRKEKEPREKRRKNCVINTEKAVGKTHLRPCQTHTASSFILHICIQLNLLQIPSHSHTNTHMPSERHTGRMCQG